jgi:hypothetical protein
LLKREVEGVPEPVTPCFHDIEENLERLESDVRSSFRFFTKEEDKTWWTSFFNNYDETGILFGGILSVKCLNSL